MLSFFFDEKDINAHSNGGLNCGELENLAGNQWNLEGVCCENVPGDKTGRESSLQS